MPKSQRSNKKHHKDGRGEAEPVVVSEARPVDGTGSNAENADWGATGQLLIRLAEAGFADDIGEMAADLPNAREISNAVAQQDGDEPSSFGLSDMFWAWGQFIDHDLDLTEGREGEFAPIPVPAGDPQFDPDGNGDAFIAFTRVGYADGTGDDSPREYANSITSFIDASMVYGSDAETAELLRGPGGTLLLDAEGLLPRDESGGVLAGDIRAGENVALTSLQTLFAREHNRIVEELAEADPSLGGDELYDAARQRVEAEVQAITYNEFLPLLVGEDAIADYSGYDSAVNPGITLEFATAAFRFGHSLLSSELQRLDEDGSVIDEGNLALRDAFFAPDEISAGGGIAPILRGLADGTAQELDTHVVEDVRSFLFGSPGDGGLDLASLNIERGRDLGVAGYNDLREALGLSRAESFGDITSDPELAAELAAVYGDVDLVDAWVGGLAEDPHGDGIIGELFSIVIIDQFERVRDGDPYWSENSGLPSRELDALWSTTLADIIERNSDVDVVQENIFLAYDRIGGGNGADTLAGDDGSDLILGEGGDDLIDGGGGDDELDGGRGDDLLAGGAGSDLISGGRGTDVLTLTGSSDDYVIEFDGRTMLVTDSSGETDQVTRVELVHFLGDATSFDVERRALEPASDTAVIDRLLTADRIAQLTDDPGAGETNMAELQVLGLIGDDPDNGVQSSPDSAVTSDDPVSVDEPAPGLDDSAIL